MEDSSILVVDDEPMAREVLSELVAAEGYNVLTADRGEDAFEWLDEVDLVLLDAMLPDRDGWSVCREIKQRYDPLLPVIMVTARTTSEDVVRTFDAGADDYVPKPLHSAELMARIASRLRVRRAELELKRANTRLAELADQNYRLYEQAHHDAEERALLLRELDHRVRNNLSVILGLVSMERNRRPPRPSAEALASLEDRLRSFLMVHEALRRESYRGVPILQITEQLAQRLRNALDPERRVDIDISGRSPPLDERQGFALALTLNELITNALEHAFPGGRTGAISVDIGESDGELRVEVVDDGVGTSGGEQEDSAVHGSGRSIMNALVHGELDGRIDFDTRDGGGTRVLIRFAYEEPDVSQNLPR